MFILFVIYLFGKNLKYVLIGFLSNLDINIIYL